MCCMQGNLLAQATPPPPEHIVELRNHTVSEDRETCSRGNNQPIKCVNSRDTRYLPRIAMAAMKTASISRFVAEYRISYFKEKCWHVCGVVKVHIIYLP